MAVFLILDRKCKKCGNSPAEYEEYKAGYFRRECRQCRSEYIARWHDENDADNYKPRAPGGVIQRPALVKRCRKCQEVKPVSEFYYAVQATDKRQSHCKKCQDEVREARRLNTPHDTSAQRIRMERFKKKLAPYREQVFQHYGDACYCCGETNRGFLTVDHVNNDGHQARREKRGGTGAFKFKEIAEMGFPKDLRLACYNCNSGRARTPGNICPHETERRQLLNLAA